MKKVKFAAFVFAMAVSTASAFSQGDDDGTTKTCDASNTNYCEITDVGKATGKLIVNNNLEEQ